MGFQFKDNRTQALTSYRWHLDDIEFVSSINLEADSALLPAIPANGIVGNCPARVLPISAVVLNQGVSTLDTVVLGYRYNNGPVYSQAFLTNLAPGQRDTLTISSANLVAPNATGTVRLRIFTINPQDQQASNDTIRLSFLITPAQPMPGTTLADFNALLGAGFTQARTRAEVPTANNVFALGTSYGPADRTAVYLATANNLSDQAAWLISPMYNYSVTASLYFQVSVTSGTTGTSAVTSIGTDSLKVLYRLRCGDWQLLGAYTQAELASGALSNRLTPKGLQVPAPAPDSIQFAFQVARGSSAASASYRWHINKVRIADEPLATRPSLNLPGLSLYPVPARNSLQVSFGKVLPEAALRITDLRGRTLIAAKAAGQNATLDVCTLPAGFYLLTVETRDGQATRSFSVE